MRRIAFLFLAVILASCSSPSNEPTHEDENASPVDSSYGYSETNPIRIGGGPDHGPSRERWFFDHLRDSDGQSITYEHKGTCCESVSTSNPYTSTELYIYEVHSSTLEDPIELYVDIYTCNNPRAPQGFIFEGESGWQGDLYFLSESAIFIEDIGIGIYHLESDSNCLHHLNITEIPNGPFDVSPDGEWIVFSRQIDDSMLLFSARIDGTDERQLTEPPARDSTPAWAPDGQSVVFMREGESGSNLYMIHADGRELQRLTTGNSVDTEPLWSPDGSKISFTSDRDGDFEIYILDIESEEILQLTDNSGFDASSSWSPTGGELVFMSDRDGGINLYLIPEIGGEATPLTEGTSTNIFPVWSPDGNFIAYCSDIDLNMNLYIMNVDNGDIQQLTDAVSSDLYPVWIGD